MKTALSVQTAKPTCDIIIVTFNNLNMLDRCLMSIKANTAEPVRIIVVNNGTDRFDVPGDAGVTVLNSGSNLGWTDGVNAGVAWALSHDPAPFIMWMNDDTQILPHDYGWLTKMLNCFQLDPLIAAVGPTSNNVMGYQTTNHIKLRPAILVTFLSGMCMLVRRSVVEEMGPLEQGKAGGDDLDYSMRLTAKGYKICVCRRAFILHFCSVTGRRLFGDYWNSPQQAEDINTLLIKKHGFKKWMECVQCAMGPYNLVADEEGLALKELLPIIDAGGVVLDLGCGGKKIHEKSVGVDIRANGQVGVGANSGIPSTGEIEADIINLPMDSASVDGILAKHLFEHIMDPITALKEWRRVLKDNGTLVIICPDYRYCEAISVDPSHVHAFTPDSVRSLLELCGFTVSRTENVPLGYVFMISAQKAAVPGKIRLVGPLIESYNETAGCF